MVVGLKQIFHSRSPYPYFDISPNKLSVHVSQIINQLGLISFIVYLLKHLYIFRSNKFLQMFNCYRPCLSVFFYYSLLSLWLSPLSVSFLSSLSSSWLSSLFSSLLVSLLSSLSSSLLSSWLSSLLFFLSY